MDGPLTARASTCDPRLGCAAPLGRQLDSSATCSCWRRESKRPPRDFLGGLFASARWSGLARLLHLGLAGLLLVGSDLLGDLLLLRHLLLWRGLLGLRLRLRDQRDGRGGDKREQGKRGNERLHNELLVRGKFSDVGFGEWICGFGEWICRIATPELGQQNGRADITMISPECGSVCRARATFDTVARLKAAPYPYFVTNAVLSARCVATTAASRRR